MAQSVDFEHISLAQGLSQSSVYAITQDKYGFLWFATQDGLDRYDGYVFRVFRNDPADSTSISGNYILRLMVDTSGNVWAGTASQGVCVFDQSTGRFTKYLHLKGDQGSLSNNSVHAIYQDPSGTVWIGTISGLNRFDPATGSFRRYYFKIPGDDSIRCNYITGIFEDREHRMWIGSLDGVGILDKNSGTLFKIKSRNIVVNKIIQTYGGPLLFVGSGIYRYDSSRNSLVPWKKKLTDLIEKDIGSEGAVANRDGTMWIGSYGGLGFIGVRKDTVTAFRHNPNDPHSLSENSVLSLYKDRSGILWLGTYDGINKYVPAKKKFEYYTFNPKDDNSLSNIRVRSFSEDRNGRIWIATQGGLDRYDPATERFTRYNAGTGVLREFGANTFWTVLADRKSRKVSIWAGTNGGGIYVLTFPHANNYSDPRAHPISVSVPQYKALFTNVINSLYQDRSGDIWAGTSYGVIRLAGSAKDYKETVYPFPTTVNLIFQDSNGTIWIGGYSLPLHRMIADKFVPAFKDSVLANTLAGASVLSMQEDREGRLWVGTYGGLLQITDSGKIVRMVTIKDGLPNDVIYAILIDSGDNLWLSTDMGLTRYSPATGEMKNYTEDDGLQSNEFNQGSALRSADGKFYFGGINGFNSFFPDSIHDNPVAPQVVLTDFKIFNTSVVPSAENARLDHTIWTTHRVFLRYTDAVLTFDFAALEFTDPSRNLFEYRLEGFDKDWVNRGTEREVTYTNLDPGNYVLHVRASNNDGVWNLAGTSLAITIFPPWWMTWWARATVILLALLTGPIIYYRRVNALKKQNALQQQFSRNLIENQEAERNRIAAELHDTIGQDLLVIKNRAFLARKSKPLNTNARKQIDSISETVTESLQNVRQIVRNLRPYHLERVGLTSSIRTMLEAVSMSSTIAFNVSIGEIDHVFSDEEADKRSVFFRIIQESINNLVKHSEARNASVEIAIRDGQLFASIRDDGIGFDREATTVRGSKAGLGLLSMTERARMLGGNLVISTERGKGTTVKLSVPLSTARANKSESVLEKK